LPRGDGFAHHGGLTPAALVDVHLCTANVVILPADGRCNSARSGGVSPPWGLLTRMQQPSAHPLSAVCRTEALVSAQTCFPDPRRVDARRSLRSPVADRGLIFTVQGRLRTPRRADARRSCRVFGCAWQIAHFAANERRAPGAADVSQPWETLRIHRHETRICHNIGACSLERRAQLCWFLRVMTASRAATFMERPTAVPQASSN
jgi:hypothetical protein